MQFHEEMCVSVIEKVSKAGNTYRCVVIHNEMFDGVIFADFGVLDNLELKVKSMATVTIGLKFRNNSFEPRIEGLKWSKK